MQWNREENAGFSTGEPWMRVNPNYEKINVEDALSRKDSVFYTYQKLIALRKQMEIIVYGDYELLLPDDPNLYVYTRTLGEQKLLVVCSYADKTVSFDLPEEFAGSKVLIDNYAGSGCSLSDALDDSRESGAMKIIPYGAFVLYKE